jgi:tetratricopeptide (TPR) repeat protein
VRLQQMVRKGSGRLLQAFAVIFSLSAAAEGLAQPPPGTPIVQATRPTLAGPPAQLLGEKETASVILFFRTGQENSKITLLQMAECEREFKDRVHWAAVVPAGAPRAEVQQLVSDSGLQAPVLLDDDDKLYGALHVVLHPVVVIVDHDHKLFAFEPFRKINYCIEVRAKLQRILGLISEEELARTLNPERVVVSTDKTKAGRFLKMGEMRLETGEFEKAAESAKKALELDGQAAAGHTLLGRALAGKGDCEAAAKEFAAALALEPKDEKAQAGLKGCEKK